MDSAIETIQLSNNRVLKIYQDLYPESPRNWDNMATFICFHKRYDLGDKHNIDHNDYESWQEMIEANTNEGDIIEPLYLLDHGQLSISNAPFMCPWDSGRIGYAVITKETIIKEYGNDSLENRSKALKYLESEISVYDDYLQGSVYGYVLSEIYTDNRGYEREEQIDSCFGFYGYDHEKSGLFEDAGINKKEIA